MDDWASDDVLVYIHVVRIIQHRRQKQKKARFIDETKLNSWSNCDVFGLSHFFEEGGRKSRRFYEAPLQLDVFFSVIAANLEIIGERRVRIRMCFYFGLRFALFVCFFFYECL